MSNYLKPCARKEEHEKLMGEGESFYWSTIDSGFNFKDAIEWFMSEDQYYADLGFFGFQDDPVRAAAAYQAYKDADEVSLGHFMQIIWAATTEVGCHQKTCFADGTDNYEAVCRYNG